MIYGIVWSSSSKKTKLNMLRDECASLQAQVEAERRARERLLAHLGLMEVNGPRFITILKGPEV